MLEVLIDREGRHKHVGVTTSKLEGQTGSAGILDLR